MTVTINVTVDSTKVESFFKIVKKFKFLQYLLALLSPQDRDRLLGWIVNRLLKVEVSP